MVTMHDVQNLIIMVLMRRLDINGVEISREEAEAAKEQIHERDGFTHMKVEVGANGNVICKLNKGE